MNKLILFLFLLGCFQLQAQDQYYFQYNFSLEYNSSCFNESQDGETIEISVLNQNNSLITDYRIDLNNLPLSFNNGNEVYSFVSTEIILNERPYRVVTNYTAFCDDTNTSANAFPSDLVFNNGNFHDYDIRNTNTGIGVFTSIDATTSPVLFRPVNDNFCTVDLIFTDTETPESVNGLTWYYLDASNTEQELNNFSNNYPLKYSIEQVIGSDYISSLGSSPMILYYKYQFNSTTTEIISENIIVDFVECSPGWLATDEINETCSDLNDGRITLTFDGDIDPNSRMRYYIFENTGGAASPGDAFTANFEGDRDDPNFPEVKYETLFDSLNDNNDGTFSGSMADGDVWSGNTAMEAGEYYVLYQEIDYSVSPVVVKSGELVPNFIVIEEPTNIDITSLSITQPACSDNQGEVTVIAEGGGFDPNPNSATLEYGIQKDGGAINWTNPTATFSNLDSGDYLFYARTSSSCISEASAEVSIVVPNELLFTNELGGQASAPDQNDGAVSAIYSGGTFTNNIVPDSAFEIAFSDGSPVSNSTLAHNTINNSIQFQGLGVGLYNISITDSNNCSSSTIDLEVTASPIPQLVVQEPFAPFCNNGTDGEVSIELIGTVNPYTYRVTNITTNTATTNSDTQAQFDVTDLSPGDYTIEIIFTSTGDFNVPSTIATDTFTIDNPDELTIGLVDIVGLDCNATTNGYIEISISETGPLLQYSYRNLGTWLDLDPSLRIPITQAGIYNDIKFRTRRNTSDFVGCESTNELDNIIVPEGITVTEDILLHQNVTTNGGNDGAIFIDVSGGNGSIANYTFEWTGVLLNGGGPYTSNLQNIQNLVAGNYSVLVRDEKNCEITFGPIQITEPGPLSIEALSGTNTCNGLNTGTITANVQGTGDITFEFLRNPGPTETIAYTITTPDRTVTAPDLTAGTYGLRVTEVIGGNTITTPAIDYFTINELTPITAIATPTDLNCNETNTGIITVTGATGGSNSGFEYAIDDGLGFQTNNTFTGLAPRQYVVTVRDDLGCEFNTTVNVVQAGTPIVNELTTIVTNASSATSIDGSIVLEFETDPTNYTYSWSGPGVTSRITKDLDLIGAGTYQVIVTAPGNCTLTRSFTVGVATAFSIQSFIGADTCFNQSTGSLTASIVATGAVTFNWFDVNDPVTPVATETTTLRTLSTQNLGAGTYYLEIVDTNGTTVRSTNDVEIVELAEVSATINPIATCLGLATGSITFSNSIGSPSNTYSYSIDNGLTFQASPVFENLAAGNYTPRVSIAENNTCDFIAPGVVIGTSPGLFYDEPNTTITRASGPGANDGSIVPAFTGGTLPYTYLWSNGEISATVSNLSAGTYSVTLTDAAGCMITQAFEVTEVGPLTISNIVPTDVLCREEANGSITTTVTGEGTITYQWTLEDGSPVPVSNGVTGQNIDGILAGSYILTATDDNATVATAAIVIGEPATTVTITNIIPTDISCFGDNDGALEIQAGGGTGPYTYSINGGAFQTSPIFNNLIANSYSVRVRDSNDCEFAEPAPVLLIEPEALNLIINEQRPVTAANATNGAIFITVEGGSGNYTYNWTGPNGFSATDEDILNLATGDYSVTITDDNFALNNGAGCRLISAPITITEPGQLIANLTQTILLECSGDDFAEITANVQGGVTPYLYEWFQVVNGNNTLLTEDTDIIGNLSVGTYFVRATDANSVSVDSNPITVTAPTQVEITVDNTTNVLCAGQATGAINVTVTGGFPPYQYFWSNSATVPDINGLDAGDYILDVEDAAGCIAQRTITITAPADGVQVIDAAITNVSAYQAIDGAISLDVSGGLPPYTYDWTRQSDNSNVGNQSTISNLEADSYSVSISDSNGCTITETYEVTQPDIIEETIVQPSCSGESDGSISVLVNQGTGEFTYLWNTGITENSINNLPAGSYTVTVTGLADGPVTRTYVLENPVPLEVDLGVDRVLCANQTLELDATVADETASYSWTSDNGFTSSEASVVLSETGNYIVTVQSQTGCTTQGAISVAISTDEIDAEFAMSSQAFVGETIMAVDLSYPLPEGIEWIVPVEAEVITQDTDAVEFSFSEPGEYDITIITTRGECIAQKTKKIVVVAKDGLIQENGDKNGQKLVEDFMVYPNPTDGRFTADINLTERGDISIKIFSFANNALMASQKERGETNYSIPFDISGMPSGVYAVLLETPYGTSLRKIVVR